MLWTTHGRAALGAIVLGALAAIPFGAAAAEFPQNKPIRLLVGAAAGGGTDIVARLLVKPLGDALQRSVIVENRPGGNFVPVTEALKQSEPDGHTLLVMTNSFAMTKGLRPGLPYDLVKDFAPVTLVSTGPLVLVTRNDLPVKSLKELLDLARSKPGELKYASAGSGTVTHLPAEMMLTMAKAQMLHVPFQGGGPALIALLGNQVDLMFDPSSTLVPQIKKGAVRPIAVTGGKRLPEIPDVPTMAEAGLTDFDVESWVGVIAPKATPPEVIARLRQELIKAVQTAEVADRLGTLGLAPASNTPEAFLTYIGVEVDRWTKVVKDAGIKAD